MSDILSKSKTLEVIDLSFNNIDQKTIFCIAHGLKHTQSLKTFAVEGNPIGAVGLRYVLQAMNQNQHGVFKMNLKEISADRDTKQKTKPFDINNPEANYSLNVGDTYDLLILQSLLTCAEKAVARSEGKFDIKACFYGVKFNGKTNWIPPATKDNN